MTILERILANKRSEVAASKQLRTTQVLEQSFLFQRKCLSLSKALLQKERSGIIAEFKRKSPSKGDIFAAAKTSEVCPSYQNAGASALSILSDNMFFGGSLDDIEQARPLVSLPILRKDFMIDEYQIIEAKAVGADVILLIAAALSVEQCQKLAGLAKSLGLEVLLEVHSKQELNEYLNDQISLVGVNNRDLKTFEIRMELSEELEGFIPSTCVKVAESGIKNPQQVNHLKKIGYRGFLIGESFMSSTLPGESCANFIRELEVL